MRLESHCGLDQSDEKLRRALKTGSQLRMELACHEERMIWKLHDLHNRLGRSLSREDKALSLETLDKDRVDLIPVAETLTGLTPLKRAAARSALLDFHIMAAETHRAAFRVDSALLRKDINDRSAGRIDLSGMGISDAAHVTRELDHRQLHTITDAKERNATLARMLDDTNLALDTAAAKTARDDDATHTIERVLNREHLVLDLGSLDPFDLHITSKMRSSVEKSLLDAEV